MKEEKANIIEIPLGNILPNRFQPRIKFNEESILELSDSIKVHGVIQPIIVRPIGDKYEIVAGERRYKASVLAGLNSIPSIIFDLNDKESAELALIENVQRKDLSPVEEAISYKKILDMGYLTQSDLATKLGRSQSSVANKIRLLNLCDDIQEALMDEKISERHARSLLKLETSDEQRKMLKKILSKKLTVRALDDEINYYKKNGTFKIEDESKVNLISNENNVESNNIQSVGQVIEKKFKINELIDEKKLGNDELKDTALAEDLSKVIKLPDDMLISDDKEEKRENEENMNNMQNLNGEINYNSLSQPDIGTSSGRFFELSQNNDEKNNNVQSSQVFNFGLEESNTKNNIMKDLMAPQGSTNLFKNGTANDTIIPIAPIDSLSSSNTALGEDNTNQSSIFSDLMNNSEKVESEKIDNETFNKFLDPSFIDGSKQQSAITNSGLESSVFSKFLNPESSLVSSTTDENIPTFSNNILDNNEIDIPSNTVPNIFNSPTIPAQSTSSSSIFNNISSTPTNTIFSTPLVVEEKSDLEDTSSNSNDLNNMSVVTNFNSTTSDLLSSSDSKPDLLAPMTREEKVETHPNPIDIFGSENKNSINLNSDEFLPIFDVKSSVGAESNDLDKVDNQIESSTIAESLTKPIFVTASKDYQNLSIPTIPILENNSTQNEDILSTNNLNENSELDSIDSMKNSVDTSSILEHSESKDTSTKIDTESSFMNSINNQPIIVTDYNKQYDPILPDSVANNIPQIDFRKIINMIRELSDTIESYGYEIDTDEIDLQDKYQVIFNITKK